jgi:hypothetical protein
MQIRIRNMTLSNLGSDAGKSVAGQTKFQNSKFE